MVTLSLYGEPAARRAARQNRQSVSADYSLCSQTRGVRNDLTNRGPHAVSLGVYQAADLREVAVALADVLNAGRLHQESVVGGENPLDPFTVVLHQRRVFPAAHEGPHLLIG